MNTNQLWKDRFNQHIKMLSRYLKLMFNDHLAFALIFFVAAFAYFYQQWLQTVPQNFPVEWMAAIIFGFLVTFSSVRTFLKQADEVFLLPIEDAMKPYMRNAFIYSLIIQGYWLALFLFALTPLMMTVKEDISIGHVLGLFAFLVVLKIGNLLATWFAQKTRDNSYHYVDYGVRLVVNTLFVFFVVSEVWTLAALAAIVFIGIMFVHYTQVNVRNSFPWDLLIEREEEKLQFFYRMANLSTDVPNLKQKPKKRHWLVRQVTSTLSFKQEQSFFYLYSITFLRSRDYFGMYFRLILLSIFFVYWIPLFWGKVFFSLLLLFVSGFQFITIYHHHKGLDWIKLYPVPESVRKKAIHQMILLLMIIQILVVFPVYIWFGNLGNALIFTSLAIVLTILFETFYLKNRMNRMSDS
ncbi:MULTISPECIES: ABC transporter permease [Allobacillus]|uniref:ABC transporter permease n=1 Tax=Allobacillus salarius TaxID=1955272 RepID=A0A556PNR3_9BACI|nr:ABC transporter permease [Allobacillus salarius]TSJ66032.1 ABC transporter permease [Allobacillus salarius]